MDPVSEGALLWQPSRRFREESNMARYMAWLADHKGLSFAGYDDLWQWSVTELEEFWASIYEFFPIRFTRPYRRVLADRRMPGARWFPGAELNFAEHALRRRDDRPAVIFASETQGPTMVTAGVLAGEVAALATGLRRLGVNKGDRIAAYVPNIPQAVVAFLAAASLGAIWSVCSPELGVRSVVDRFRQIEPKVLFAVDGYRYGGKEYDRLEAVGELQRFLPSVEKIILIPGLREELNAGVIPDACLWSEVLEPAELAFEPVPFDHPLWIVYSSGTTGLPKPIVHGHGGIVLAMYKLLSLHTDLKPGDRFFWLSSTSWIMWNIVVGALLLKATIVLYDGNPGYPDLGALWRLVEEAEVTHFGAGAPFLLACMKAGLQPGRSLGLEALRLVGSTGGPLPPEGFAWVYDEVKRNVLLASVSGGTDVVDAFVGSCPILPVYPGEIQGRSLGAAVYAYNDRGEAVTNQVGELVCTEPLPSMPLYLWNDPDNRRYHESYFEMFPGKWRHGDWIKITDRGTCIIYGRSDATLKRGGVRMGTADFYRVVESLPGVVDSLVVDTSGLCQEGRLLVFVVPEPGASLDEDLQGQIIRKIREELSPRHVPDAILAIPEVPYTLNGKKLEVPVRKILTGTPIEETVSLEAMRNPKSMHFFGELAKEIRSGSKG